MKNLEIENEERQGKMPLSGQDADYRPSELEGSSERVCDMDKGNFQ